MTAEDARRRAWTAYHTAADRHDKALYSETATRVERNALAAAEEEAWNHYTLALNAAITESREARGE